MLVIICKGGGGASHASPWEPPRQGFRTGVVSEVDVADRMEAGAHRWAVLSWAPPQYDIHLGRPCDSWSRPYSLGFSFWTLQRTHGSSRGPTLSLCSGPFSGEWRGESWGPCRPTRVYLPQLNPRDHAFLWTNQQARRTSRLSTVMG